MNPQLVYNLDFSFFKNLFSSSNGEEEKNKKSKNENQKKYEKVKINKELNILKKDSYKSSETAYTEEENNRSKKKEDENTKNLKEKVKENGKLEEKKLEKEKMEINEETIESHKKENIKGNEVNFVEEEKKSKILKKKKNLREKKSKDQLLLFLLYFIKNIFLFRKKVKNLIKKHKENFAIISSVNKNNLSMNIKINEESIKKVKYIYEPILNENIFYIPRKLFKKKNLVKFSFVNKKNESIIDPKFNTEYDEGEFINVINLKKIKDKEEENEEEFQIFLESYYTIKSSLSKEVKETNKLSLGVVRVKKKHKTMDNKGGLFFGGNKFPSNSILKQRPIKRITSNKKISFSDKNETLSYKKGD